ncbi:hypothetical protein QTP88_019414 [Uroleucon formosanum]
MIEVGYAGRNSDGGIFRVSAMKHWITHAGFDIPPPSLLKYDENKYPFPYYLVADEAFPLSGYLMRPYAKKTLDNMKRIFNYRLSRSRKTIECTFEMAAEKWAILNGPIRGHNPKKVNDFIKAACILHNYVRKTEGLEYTPIHIDDHEIAANENYVSPCAEGLRGKDSHSGNFQDLLKLRMEARVTDSMAFSLMADDIAGKEQLSIGVRYVTQTYDEKEEFLGFVELQKLNAELIASSIVQFTSRVSLDMSKLVGLSYDGCSTMNGKENGVQAEACPGSKLVNDQNSLPEIRNTIGTVKETIKFFRESILRRQLISNIPLLCETRWSEKYKCIRIFNSNFFEIKLALSKLATDYDTNSATRTKAYQLSRATSTIGFIVCLKIIAKYSKLFEPIVNKLQAVNTNLHTVYQHIHSNLLKILKKRRSMSEENFSLIFNDVKNCANQFNLDIQIPRVVSRQAHRQNIVVSTPDEYFRISMYIPHIDSLIQSLEVRFSPINEIPFKLGFLHPSVMLKMTKINFINILQGLDKHYKIENLVEEGQTWYDYWEMMQESSSISETKNISFFFKKLVNFILL